MFAVLLILALTTSSVSKDQQFDLLLLPVLDGRSFDWVAWESGAVWEELGWWLQGRALPGDGTTQRAEVLAFLERQNQIMELRQHIRRLDTARTSAAAADSILATAAVAPAETELTALLRRQAEATSLVERIVAAQVSRVLSAQGIGSSDAIWPPVAFRFDVMPAYLVISPRTEIRMYRSVFLWPKANDAERAALESVVEAQPNVSALVDDVGGIGSWPTMVSHSTSLCDLFDTVAHEWVHTYLLFHPLGLNYAASRDLTTMNETVASLVGAEVAELAGSEIYPEVAAEGGLPCADATKPREERAARPADDFSVAMRRIRQQVDDLLAAGRVSEAEALMEAERARLVEAGYALRRLNQAYFAFHGSYATSAASVDPIGPWMRQLRLQSGSLKMFLQQVAGMASLDDLLSAIGERQA